MIGATSGFGTFTGGVTFRVLSRICDNSHFGGVDTRPPRMVGCSHNVENRSVDAQGAG